MHYLHEMHNPRLMPRMLIMTVVTGVADECHFCTSMNRCILILECAIFHKWVIVMAEMLTSSEMQELLQVDRSTIYRMAESGRLPAIKVGKQWRFPVEKVEAWLRAQTNAAASIAARTAAPLRMEDTAVASESLKAMLPLACVQLIQDCFADLLGVMLVVTDMEGNPITRISNPCGLFEVVNQKPNALQHCIRSWHDLATIIELEPGFSRSHLGLLCTRGMIRVGSELKGMVVAGCIAPEEWPPSSAELSAMAEEFGVPVEQLAEAQEQVYFLNESERGRVLTFIQRIANVIAHIVNERMTLVSRLQAIADLTTI